MNPVAWWFTGHEYLLYNGDFIERLMMVAVVAIPIILLVIFWARHNKGVRDDKYKSA